MVSEHYCACSCSDIKQERIEELEIDVKLLEKEIKLQDEQIDKNDQRIERLMAENERLREEKRELAMHLLAIEGQMMDGKDE